MSHAADLKPIVKHAERAGWTVEITGGGHLRWRSPTGALVFSSSTPNCPFASKKIRACLRRHGLDIPKK